MFEIKEWEKLDFKNPTALVPLLIRAIQEAAIAGLPARTVALFGKDQKRNREMLDAALFAHGISIALDHPSLEFSMIEKDDYDCVCRWVERGEVRYAPVQLKQVPPTTIDVKGTTSLQQQIDALLIGYPDSRQLIVAIRLNRAGTINFSELKVPPLKIGGLWIYASLDNMLRRWILVGDMLVDPRVTEFDAY